MGDGKDGMVIFARQLPLENDIQPCFPFDPSATGTMAIIARSVDDTSVSATATLELVGSERSIATAKDFAQLTATVQRERLVVLCFLAMAAQRCQHAAFRLTGHRTCERCWINIDGSISIVCVLVGWQIESHRLRLYRLMRSHTWHRVIAACKKVQLFVEFLPMPPC